jgi:hypothetical protein
VVPGRQPDGARRSSRIPTDIGGLLTGRYQPRSGERAEPAPQSLESELSAELNIPEANRAGYEAFGTALTADGVRPEIGRAIFAWMAETRKNGAPPEYSDAKHGYYFDGVRFKPEDQTHLASFGAAMKAAGATQADVDAALRLYGKIQKANTRENAAAGRDLEQLDHADKAKARDFFRSQGEEAATNYQLVKGYLERNPAERERLERERDANGVAALNDPRRLEQLIKKARGGTETREQIEALMAEKSSRYWRGSESTRLQARYRDLVSTGTRTQDGPLPTDRASIDAELAELEERMKSPRTWSKDNRGQRRYRALLETKERS